MKDQINYSYMTFLAVVAALGGFLFGYDTAVISGTISDVAVQFDLDTVQEGWYVGCALVGSIIGVLLAGILTDKYGRKKILILSAVLFAISSLGCAVCGTFDQLVFYRIVGGIGIGVVSIVSPLYISEVSAAQFRGRLVALYQLAITIGFLGAYLINFALLGWAEQNSNMFNSDILILVFHAEAWRGMLGMAAVPAFLFLLSIFFIPESPKWLIVKGNEHLALITLKRIYVSDHLVSNEVAQTKGTIGEDDSVDWRILLTPGIMWAVIIGCAIAIIGQFMGVNAVFYYGSKIFEDNGLVGGDSLFYQVMVGLANVVATILAVFMIDKVGLKKLIYYGVSAMIVFLLLIAVYFSKGEEWQLPSTSLLFFFMGYIFSCAISISAVIFVLLSEMYSTRIRGLAMSITGFALWVGTFLIGQLTPWLLTTLSPAGTFIFFAFACVPYMLVIWKEVPETTGKSLEDIARFWSNKEEN